MCFSFLSLQQTLSSTFTSQLQLISILLISFCIKNGRWAVKVDCSLSVGTNRKWTYPWSRNLVLTDPDTPAAELMFWSKTVMTNV